MKFLSEEWFWEAHSRLNADTSFIAHTDGASLRLWLEVAKAPDWARDVTIIVGDGSIDLDEGLTGEADAHAIADYDAFLAMLRQQLNPRVAALRRKLRGKGLPVILKNWSLIDAALDVLRQIQVDE